MEHAFSKVQRLECSICGVTLAHGGLPQRGGYPIGVPALIQISPRVSAYGRNLYRLDAPIFPCDLLVIALPINSVYDSSPTEFVHDYA